jgi:hypothetical protein
MKDIVYKINSLLNEVETNEGLLSLVGKARNVASRAKGAIEKHIEKNTIKVGHSDKTFEYYKSPIKAIKKNLKQDVKDTARNAKLGAGETVKKTLGNKKIAAATIVAHLALA